MFRVKHEIAVKRHDVPKHPKGSWEYVKTEDGVVIRNGLYTKSVHPAWYRYHKALHHPKGDRVSCYLEERFGLKGLHSTTPLFAYHRRAMLIGFIP